MLQYCTSACNAAIGTALGRVSNVARRPLGSVNTPRRVHWSPSASPGISGSLTLSSHTVGPNSSFQCQLGVLGRSEHPKLARGPLSPPFAPKEMLLSGGSPCSVAGRAPLPVLRCSCFPAVIARRNALAERILRKHNPKLK